MKVSRWIVVEGHCATRVIAGGDIGNVRDRVAFIEKTPRVRVSDNIDVADYENWKSGPKGRVGSLEDDGETIYGFYKPSRDWCDKQLLKMGYEL